MAHDVDVPVTLENYRQLCALVGFAKAEKFLKDVIAREGKDAEIVPPGHMLNLLYKIEFDLK